MNTQELVKQVFNGKFFRYFFLTFIVLLSVSLFGFYTRYIDLFIESRAGFGVQVKCWVLSAAALLPSTLSVSLSVAVFLAFRKIPQGAGVKGFFKVYGCGLAVASVLAAGACFYDMNITPSLKAKTSAEIYHLRSRGVPRNIEAGREGKISFRNFSPSTTGGTMLSHRIDSLKGLYTTLADDCATFLGELPDSLAARAYDSYHLDIAGVPYTSEGSFYNPEEKGKYERYLSVLYTTSQEIHDARGELLKYRMESAGRVAGGAGLVLSYLIFGAAGFALRNRTMRVILAVIAALILAQALYVFVSNRTKTFMEEQMKTGRDFSRSNPW